MSGAWQLTGERTTLPKWNDDESPCTNKHLF